MPYLNPILEIDGHVIDTAGDCYVIAEIGNNHQGSLNMAKKMFKSAAETGVNAVKLQKRTNKELYTQKYFDSPYCNENSFGSTYGEHREYLEFQEEEYAELISYAKSLGITLIATPFDEESVDFLEGFEIPAYKIASGDLSNFFLIRKVCQLQKPVIMSTGGATLSLVQEAYEYARSFNSQIALLQCTAGYPAQWNELDLKVIETYKQYFPDAIVGLSSHDNGIAMAVAAYTLGGRIIEKHFTLDRSLQGTDHRFSLEPQGLRKMVRDLRRLRLALGDGTKKVYPSESEPIKKMSKQLVAASDLSSGTIVKAHNLKAKSPGGEGITPKDADLIIERKLAFDVRKDQPILASMIENMPPPVSKK